MIHSKDTLKDPLRHGQRLTAELVDFYNLQSTPVPTLPVRYLEERRPGVDYGTFVGLAPELAGVFWADIEAHHPGGVGSSEFGPSPHSARRPTRRTLR
ncbi:hypothetical protein ABZ490_41035 [Streptomyces sp. NPDC005811]|uniref:hypothetical protein n=1 Tax=Streptomyces sp. NPDC005811 TaxID=3154565 RepID=UPI0033C313D7